MKNYQIFVLCIVIFLFFSCSVKSTQMVVDNSNLSQSTNSSEITDSVDEEETDSQDEDQSQAEAFWSNYVATCEGSTYMKLTRGRFLELNGFNIDMDYNSITEADRLNGIQAKGSTHIRASSHRYFYDGKWHQWKDGLPSDGLTFDAKFQKKGQLTFQGTGYFNDYSQKISCSEMPRSTSAENSDLRFDGLYRVFAEDSDPKNLATYWFKFYQDGTVSYIAHDNESYKNSGYLWTVEKVWDCLVSINDQREPCNPLVYRGLYSIKGSNIEYKMTNSNTKNPHTVEGKAVIGKNSLKAQNKLKNGNYVNVGDFEFIEFNRQ